MGVLSLLIGPLTGLLKQVLPDPKAREEAQMKLIELSQQGQLAELDAQMKQQLAQAGVIQAEVASKSWLAVNWRPILMLTFGGLIVARMFGYTAPNISPSEYIELWSLVKLGIGGYIGGRSLEKIVPSVASALKSVKAS